MSRRQLCPGEQAWEVKKSFGLPLHGGVLGTRIDIADTDADGIIDGVEYPFTDIPLSDPCDGPLQQRCTRSIRLFTNGFEED